MDDNGVLRKKEANEKSFAPDLKNSDDIFMLICLLRDCQKR